MPKTIYPIERPFQPQFLPVALMAIEALAKGKVVLEYGSGHSTPWLYERASGLISVEHDPGWWEEVSRFLQEECNVWGIVGLCTEPLVYVDYVKAFPESYFDLVIVDGLDYLRTDCVRAAMPKVKPGGWLVVDDTHWDGMALLVAQLLMGWEVSVVFGDFVRLSGQKRYHQTTFYRRPECSS